MREALEAAEKVLTVNTWPFFLTEQRDQALAKVRKAIGTD